MRETAEEKWQRYERALLAAMRCDSPPSGVAPLSCRLLLTPTFHTPACLWLEFSAVAADFTICVLPEHSGIFPAAWREDRDATAIAVAQAAAARLETIVGLASADAAPLRSALDVLAPLTLADVDLAARDGLGARFDYFTPDRHHSFAMRSPTIADAPRHHALIGLFVATGLRWFPEPPFQAYLTALGAYLR